MSGSLSSLSDEEVEPTTATDARRDSIEDDEGISEISSLTEEDDEDSEEDDDVSDEEFRGPYATDPFRDVNKVSITPHHRSEKHGGRPTRRAAASASSAWSKLTPRAYRMLKGEDSEEEDEDGDVEPQTPSKRRKRREDDALRVASTSEAPLAATNADGTPKRKRGRPRKDESVQHGSTTSKSLLETPTKRKRGRPRKDEQGTPKQVQKTSEADEEEVFRGAAVMSNALGPSLIQPSSSDAYFLNHSARRTGFFAKGKTSDNVLSDDFTAITPKQVLSFSKRLTKQVQEALDGDEGKASQLPPLMSLSTFERFHDHWWSLLSVLNRPILFYGVGSKKAVVQRFARQMADEGRCSVLVVRGGAGGRIEDVVGQLERLCTIAPIADVSKAQRMAYSTPLEARAHHVVRVLAGEEDRYNVAAFPPSMLVVLHNIDAAALLQEKALRVLAILATSPKIHLCADTAHINAAMLAGLDSAKLYRDRINWLWVDLTTFVPVLDEVLTERVPGLGRTLGLPGVMDVRRAGAGSDATALAIEYRPLVGSSQNNAGSATAANGAESHLLGDRAAVHILRSVTYKARGLFLLLAQRLLHASNSVVGSTSKATLSTVPYADLSDLARNNFLAMTPDALRSLLVEFTTHGLIGTNDNVVRVALSKADLQSVVATFSSSGS